MKVLKIIGIVIISQIIILFLIGFINLRDTHPGYEVDIKVENSRPGAIYAGFSALSITPQYFEPWSDVDNNGKYEPRKGDTYEDLNGNGKFDTYWIAGFGLKAAAKGIHDDLWARTMIIDDGNSRLALVAVDVIGIFHPMVIDIREMIPSEIGITYLVITSTHTHAGPDLLGLWGNSVIKSGVNKEWKEYVKKRIVESVIAAAESIRPVSLRFTQNLNEGLVTLTDTREPYVFDEGIRIIEAVDAETSQTIGTVIQWANHPETLWSKNLHI